MDFPKKQQQCLIPRYLLQYLQDLQISHNDPTAPWGGGGGGSYTAGDGIDITDDVISLNTTPDTFEITANTGITLMAENQNPVYKDAKLLLAYTGATKLEGTDVSIEANSIHFNSDSAPWYVNNTTHEYKVLATTDQIPSLTGYVTSTDLAAELLNYAELSDLATVATSGNYNDLTNKPNLANYVTTNTEQNITKVKTIYDTSNGHSDIYFKAPLNDNRSNTMGFSAFDYNNNQIGGLQIMNRTLQFNSDESSTYYYGTFLSNFRNSRDALNTVTGFRVLPSDVYSGSYSINFVAPFGTQTDLYDVYKSNSNVNTINLVAAITDGTNTVLANKLGVVDISSLVSGGGSYTAGDGIDITNDIISIDNTVALKSEIPTVPTNVSAFTNDAGYITGITSTDVTTALGYTPGTSNFSGDYDDLTDKPTIPTISGSYSGSYWTSININGTSKSIPSISNCVTLNTDQNITGIKTFVGDKRIAFKQASSSNNNTLGFTAYKYNNIEYGNLQIASRNVGGVTSDYVTLGNFSGNLTKAKIGFRIQPNSSNSSYNFIMPYGDSNQFENNGYTTYQDTTIPCAFTDGQMKINADSTGLVDFSDIITVPFMIEINGTTSGNTSFTNGIDFYILLYKTFTYQKALDSGALGITLTNPTQDEISIINMLTQGLRNVIVQYTDGNTVHTHNFVMNQCDVGSRIITLIDDSGVNEILLTFNDITIHREN